jgi:hypothetical protein
MTKSAKTNLTVPLRRRSGVLSVLAAALTLLGVGPAPNALAGKSVDSLLLENTLSSEGVAGTSGDRLGVGPKRGLAIDEASGQIYVAQKSLNRIARFDADGDFELVWGRDVVKSGGAGNVAGANEQQLVSVNATGGTFTLTVKFIEAGTLGDSTAQIPFDASAAMLEAALEETDVVDSGDVAVGGPAGGPWTVEFTGALADTDVFRTGINDNELDNDGEPPSGVATLVHGGGPMEICTVASQCKVGGVGDAFDGPGGEMAEPEGLALSPNGDLFVADFNNARVQRFSFDDGGTPGDPSDDMPVFEQAWGRDVVRSGQPGDVAGDEQQALTLTGAIGGQFAVRFEHNAEREFEWSAPLPFEATAAAVQSALEGLGTIEPGDVAVSGAAGGPWTIDFEGRFEGRDVPAVAAASSESFVADELVGPDPEEPPELTITALDGGGFEVCETAADCQSGAYGSHPGQLNAHSASRNRLAVDPTDGELYVGDSGNRRIVRYDPDAASAAEVFVESFGGEGTGVGKFSSGQPEFVAFDPGGILYASDDNSDRVQRLDPAVGFLPPLLQEPAGPLLTGQTDALAVDPGSGNLLVWRNPSGTAEPTIQEIDPETDEEVDQHIVGAGFIAQPNSLVANAADGRIYLVTQASGTGDPGNGGLYVLDADGSPPPVAVLEEPDVGTHAVTLKGAVNPNGSLYTVYRFEFSADGEDWTAVPAQDAQVGVGTTPITVEETVEGLEPNTNYLTRLVATKAYGAGVATTESASITTEAAPPQITGVAVDSIQETKARLIGRVDPESSESEYFFEYGTDAGYGIEVPIPHGALGSGPSKLFVAEPITGLTPGTEYHFRLVAENQAGTSMSADSSFSTRSEPSPPTDRAFEMVSPSYKESGRGVGEYGVKGPDQEVVPGVASVRGDRYLSTSVAGGVLVEGAAIFASDFALSERTPSGWVSKSAFNRPEYASSGGAVGYLEPYEGTPDLSVMAWQAGQSAAVSGGQLFPEMSGWDPLASPAYLRGWTGDWEVIAPTDSSQGVVPAGYTNLGVSADGGTAYFETAINPERKAVFRGLLGSEDPSLDQLPEDEGGSTIYAYETGEAIESIFPGGGSRTLVGVCTGLLGVDRTEIPVRLASGKAAAQECPAPMANRSGRLISDRGASIQRSGPGRNAISADGSRIVFMSPDPASAGAPAACSGTAAATSCPPQLYVRTEEGSGEFAARWISRSEVEGQDASLIAEALFEGASSDGDRVFFRTPAPLTSDDPNGSCGPECTSGFPDSNSWDLYMYDFTDSPSDDPGAGDLIRLSAGPTGEADPNVSPGGGGAGLRFASDDGQKAYFVTSAPILGVPTNAKPTSGTSTTAGGTSTTVDSANLYLYDSNRPLADRWEFIARLPRSANDTDLASCATHSADEAQAKTNSGFGVKSANCFRGTETGDFVTFWTDGNLEADDENSDAPISGTGDIYAFDSEADRLLRLSAPRNREVEGYPCRTDSSTEAHQLCNADPGFDGGAFAVRDVQFNPLQGVATDPSTPGERIAFFQSRARLLPEDINDQYDVYEWRDGDMTLLSSGTSANGAYYGGNDTTGRDVFIHTKDRLTWQDVDGEMDVYDARIGGGFPEPVADPCSVLADECQGRPAPLPDIEQVSGSTVVRGLGNVRSSGRGPVNARRCHGMARRSRTLVRQAKQLLGRAGGPASPRAHNLRRRAQRLRKQAKRMTRRATTCKRRARRGGR